MSELLCLGISHKTAPLAVRERLALSTAEAEALCRELVAGEAVGEAVAISTCNRTEVYLVTGDPVAAESELLGRLGYDPVYGARPLKRVIQKRLVDRLALAILQGEFAAGDTVHVDAAGDDVVLTRGTREPATAA